MPTAHEAAPASRHRRNQVAAAGSAASPDRRPEVAPAVARRHRVAALLFGGFLALQGHDPLAVYQTLYLGAFGTRFSVENTLTQAAPLLLTALCTLIPARVGLLVIGGEGAVVTGRPRRRAGRGRARRRVRTRSERC